MSQQPIEVILTSRLAAHLSMATFLVDAEGRPLHMNARAHEILGERIEDTRDITARDLATLFETRDMEGKPIPADQLPLVIALEKRHPSHARLRVRGVEGQDRDVAVTAIPLVGQGSRFVGAIAFFWELPK